ncbi:hypothetical protein JYK02_08550 [Corallococcus macrosporus]|uniref:Uncharacterized protein n=1 Tax=Corallococcus macrosporus TaxID=35 RepID=A0ABS3D7A3_9BACT|nr:hypothetical protein [Corallococcus macrosporus]MBN8227555.1 hypothetical protein [Corallococcus macrosporus]
MEINDSNVDLVDYVQFTGKPKKGQMLRYLLATQVRKRYLEQPSIDWIRQIKGAALTGNPERLIEIYYIDRRGACSETLTTMFGNGDHRQPLPFQKQILGLVPDNKTDLETHYFTQMSYINSRMSHEAMLEPYLLYTTITVDSEKKVDRFSELKRRLLPVFLQNGLRLIVAGQKISETSNEFEILNIWDFRETEDLEYLMMQLSDNQDYFELNNLGTQDQHIFRNVSRHYQFSPLLSRPNVRPESNA